jgi:hypothetical protein
VEFDPATASPAAILERKSPEDRLLSVPVQSLDLAHCRHDLRGLRESRVEQVLNAAARRRSAGQSGQ